MPLRLEIKHLFNLTLTAVAAGLLASTAYLFLPYMIADVVATMVFAIVYFILTIWTKAWQSEDIQLVSSLVSRLPRRLHGMLPTLDRWEQNMRPKKT